MKKSLFSLCTLTMLIFLLGASSGVMICGASGQVGSCGGAECGCREGFCPGVCSQLRYVCICLGIRCAQCLRVYCNNYHGVVGCPRAKQGCAPISMLLMALLCPSTILLFWRSTLARLQHQQSQQLQQRSVSSMLSVEKKSSEHYSRALHLNLNLPFYLRARAEAGLRSQQLLVPFWIRPQSIRKYFRTQLGSAHAESFH